MTFNRSLVLQVKFQQSQNPNIRKLIIPGQISKTPDIQKQQKLIIPGKKGTSSSSPISKEENPKKSAENDLLTPNDNIRKQFKPPPGYFSKASRSTNDIPNLSNEEIIQALNDKDELWHNKANYLSILLVK